MAAHVKARRLGKPKVLWAIASAAAIVAAGATAPVLLGGAQAASVTIKDSREVVCEGRSMTARRIDTHLVKLVCSPYARYRSGPAPQGPSTADPLVIKRGATEVASCGEIPLYYKRLARNVGTVLCIPAPAPATAPPTSSPTPSATAAVTPTPVQSATEPPPPTAPVTPPPPAGTAPTNPGPVVCDSASLAGPASAPTGAVVVQPSQSLDVLADEYAAGTTFWLAPGIHKLPTGQYDQVQPKSGDTFIGAPGAILDGQHKNFYAFTGYASNVSISHLVVQNFGAPGGNPNEGVVNHDQGRNWTLSSMTIQNNAGAGTMIGSGNRVLNNCIRNNGQYGFNAYTDGGVTDIVLQGNEISGNNTDNWEQRSEGCGCTGGGKFWETNGAKVIGNYVHDNKGVGLWADTNNANFLFQDNYISSNEAEGIIYETSYNAAILDNTFVRNAIDVGPDNPGFPEPAVYISESGSDSRVAGPYSQVFRIAGNIFTDNWAGVIAWENSDRFAGSPANSSTGTTTLVNPTVATEEACSTPANIVQAPYYDDCRWKTQNLLVENNTFSYNAANIPGCSPSTGCGYNGVFAQYGSYPDWSPYQDDIVPKHITFQQNNVWRNNTYKGAANFMALTAGTRISWATWRAAPYNQDAGSTLS